jgi:hypothetical protein
VPAIDARDEVLAQGTVTGDGLVIAEISLPDALPRPQTSEPKIPISPEMYRMSDEIVPAMMVPLYQAGVRRQWGEHMAPD